MTEVESGGEDRPWESWSGRSERENGMLGGGSTPLYGRRLWGGEGCARCKAWALSASRGELSMQTRYGTITPSRPLGVHVPPGVSMYVHSRHAHVLVTTHPLARVPRRRPPNTAPCLSLSLTLALVALVTTHSLLAPSHSVSTTLAPHLSLACLASRTSSSCHSLVSTPHALSPILASIDWPRPFAILKSTSLIETMPI